jgi:hypothetical protein
VVSLSNQAFAVPFVSGRPEGLHYIETKNAVTVAPLSQPSLFGLHRGREDHVAVQRT